MPSPFEVHRDKVMGHYSTAEWLRNVVMSLWNGSGNPVGLSRIHNADAVHYKAFLDMLNHFRSVGEGDPALVRLVQEIEERKQQEREASERAQRLEAWLKDTQLELRMIGKPQGLVDDRHGWFVARFDRGDAPEAAAAECELETS